jgi:hypothetical protein
MVCTRKKGSPQTSKRLVVSRCKSATLSDGMGGGFALAVVSAGSTGEKYLETYIMPSSSEYQV